MTSVSVASPLRRRLRILRRPTAFIQPAAPRPQRRDCQGRLVTALLALAGDGATITDASFRPWCSATFLGAQHRLVMQLSGDDAPSRALALAAALPEAELVIAGHVVADLAVDGVHEGEAGENGVRLDLAVLTIEDW